MGKRRVAWKVCWHVALQSHSACSEGEHLGCSCAKRFHWLSWWGLHESQLMLCRSQFFHPISSSHGYFRKVPCNPQSLSAPCSRHCVLSPAHCQTSAEPTFPRRASSKCKACAFLQPVILKRYFCARHSVMAGPEKENTLRLGMALHSPCSCCE